MPLIPPRSASPAVDAVVHRDEIRSGPEAALEIGRLAARTRNHPAFAKDERPRDHGGHEEKQHDELNDEARPEDEAYQGEIGRHPDYPSPRAAHARPRPFDILLQFTNKRLRPPAWAPPGRADTRDLHDGLDHEPLFRSHDRLCKHQTRSAQSAHSSTHFEAIIEVRGYRKVRLRPSDDQGDSVAFPEIRPPPSPGAEPVGARAPGTSGDSRDGPLPARPYPRNGPGRTTGAHSDRGSPGGPLKRSGVGGAAGAARPKCRHATRVTVRPRGVRMR